MCNRCSEDPHVRRMQDVAAQLYEEDITFRTLANTIGAYIANTGIDIKHLTIAAHGVARYLKQEKLEGAPVESDLAERLRFKQFADHERRTLQVEGLEKDQAVVLEVIDNVIVGSGGVQIDKHVVTYLENHGITVPPEFVKA